ncbi:hypothetical protein [Ralstonia holmesii]|uniref:hypothetical protein n=1 Tax=Ralstonia holmesii TaxID=3058602 RepID=UPI0028F6BAAB|nr:hypothetical protein [Ralstonia sp. LMG 32967]CAJ0705995.1 hypothetical protein R11007_04745 [Ralstonia sp. LMG 32967]
MGKPIHPNYSGLHTSNAAKRQKTLARFMAALKDAGDEGLTFAELRKKTVALDTSLRAILTSLRADGVVHIGSFRMMRRQLVPAYVLGTGDDACIDDYRDLQAKAAAKEAEDVEAAARKEAERKHEKWQRDWKPRRAEAAWF